MQIGHVEYFWWCGSDPNPAKPSQDTDTILYESIDLESGEHVGPVVALAETPGAWDSAYTCNPKVVKGSFTDPLGDGKTYTYALYYVGTANVGGSANGIGVAFSNDGINWKKYPSPAIPTTNMNGYGAAQPVPYNSDGKQAITLFFEDDAPPYGPDHHWETTSTDGIHFQYVGLITENGVDQFSGLPAWADMGFNPADGYWYAIFNLPSRPPVTTDNVMEYGQFGFQLYRIPKDDLLIGNIGWKELKTFDTNLIGYESIFIPGLLRDPNGNVFLDSKGTMQIFPSFSNKTVTWDESPGYAASDAKLTSWDINQVSWSAADSQFYDLKQYWNGTSHLTTTGAVDGKVYLLQKTLGRIYTNPQAGATVPLWGCKSGFVDTFLSLDSGCEGRYVRGLNGYIYAQPPAGVQSTPIYRCYTGHDHFVSTDPSCEGSQEDKFLGYILPE